MCKRKKSKGSYINTVELIPIGSPIRLHPTTITIHNTVISSTIGNILTIVPNTLISSSLLYLYKNPIVIIKNIYTGEKHFQTESAALNIN